MKPATQHLSEETGSMVVAEGEMDRPNVVKLSKGTVVVFSNPKPKGGRANQDVAGIIPARADEVLLVVADGMGGMRHGGAAAARLVKHLAGKFPLVNTEVPMRAAVLDGIEEANKLIQRDLPGSGTTLAAVEICGRTIRPYHVGDSSILVIGQRGKLKLQTIAHSPVGFAVEAGLLDEREALQHDELHIVSNAIGSPEMRIELGSPLTLARRDTLLVASDGLTDNVHVEEIIGIVRKGPLVEGMTKLVNLARARMATTVSNLPSKPDDLTVVAYRRGA